MMPTFADLCTYAYVIVDELYQVVAAPHDHRPGPRGECSDSEVIALTLVAELVEMDDEPAFLAYVRPNALAPAHHADGALAEQLLLDKHRLTVLGDKAYLHAALQALLAWRNDLLLLTPRRFNQRAQWPAGLARAISHFRQAIETVAGQLA